ncbi:MAG: hypothetical protein IT382_20105 [Deltaproteobacteria bacterium]|nr:hypothetical protein [Deltaproteobacteria bacterium]
MRSPPGPAGEGNDEALALAFAEAARLRAPSRFESARAARELELALDQVDRNQRRGWRSTAVAGAVTLAAVAGVVGGLALRAPAEVAAASAAGAPAALAHETPVAPEALPSAAVPPVAATARLPELAPMPAPMAAALPTPAAPGPLVPARRAEAGWRATSAALAAAGDDAAAARLLAQALLSDEAAGAPLVAALRKAPAALDAVDTVLAPSRRPEAMRVRCELRLLYRRDRSAVEACRAFSQNVPEHPGARVLSFAAGRVAEDELGELEVAEAEYGRALLLSPVAGLPSTDALLARARVRAARGVLDEARADLRLYLHQEPAGRSDPSVQALMLRLGVQAP